MTKEKYIPGTRLGKGISFERTDNEYIQKQKEELGNVLKTKMKEKKLTLRKLETMTNIYNPQIQGITSGRTNYVIENFLRILNAMDLRIVIEDVPVTNDEHER